MPSFKIHLPRDHFDIYYKLAGLSFCYSIDDDGDRCYYKILHIDKDKVILVSFEHPALDESKEIQ